VFPPLQVPDVQMLRGLCLARLAALSATSQLQAFLRQQRQQGQPQQQQYRSAREAAARRGVVGRVVDQALQGWQVRQHSGSE
jgi:hypothetical protein